MIYKIIPVTDSTYVSLFNSQLNKHSIRDFIAQNDFEARFLQNIEAGKAPAHWNHFLCEMKDLVTRINLVSVLREDPSCIWLKTTLRTQLGSLLVKDLKYWISAGNSDSAWIRYNIIKEIDFPISEMDRKELREIPVPENTIPPHKKGIVALFDDLKTQELIDRV
jgi:hypothetical protein